MQVTPEKTIQGLVRELLRLTSAAEALLLTPAEATTAPADATDDCAAAARRNTAMRMRSLLSDSSLSWPAATDPLPPPPEFARDLRWERPRAFG